jgi:hypothetical protein
MVFESSDENIYGQDAGGSSGSARSPTTESAACNEFRRCYSNPATYLCCHGAADGDVHFT